VSHVLTVLGLPGSGKSTVARALGTARGIPVLSTGEQLRLIAERDAALAAALAEGRLGPEDLVQPMVDQFLRTHPIAVLDGYPRHRAQAELLQSTGARLWVLHLRVERDTAVSRIMQRPKRGDDRADAIHARMRRDEAALVEVLRVLSDSVYAYDAMRSPDAIVHDVLQRFAIEASTD
jgi:adenylate kinase family enzyme